MTFKLLCIAMIIGIAVSIIWLIVELRADKRDQGHGEVTVPKDRLPPKTDI